MTAELDSTISSQADFIKSLQLQMQKQESELAMQKKLSAEMQEDLEEKVC